MGTRCTEIERERIGQAPGGKEMERFFFVYERRNVSGRKGGRGGWTRPVRRGQKKGAREVWTCCDTCVIFFSFLVPFRVFGVVAKQRIRGETITDETNQVRTFLVETNARRSSEPDESVAFVSNPSGAAVSSQRIEGLLGLFFSSSRGPMGKPETSSP